MSNIIQFTPKAQTESLESLATRAINMFDKFKQNVTDNFLSVPMDTLQEPRKDGWQTYLILHLVKIGYSTAEELTQLSDEALAQCVTDDQERIRLLQFSFMRKHFDDSILPDNVPKIKSIN